MMGKSASGILAFQLESVLFKDLLYLMILAVLKTI